MKVRGRRSGPDGPGSAWWTVLVVVLASLGRGAAPAAAADPWVPAGPTVALAMSAPASVVAGAPFAVTVTARDAAGAVATSYRGTVAFGSDDGRAPVLPGGVHVHGRRRRRAHVPGGRAAPGGHAHGHGRRPDRPLALRGRVRAGQGGTGHGARRLGSVPRGRGRAVRRPRLGRGRLAQLGPRLPRHGRVPQHGREGAVPAAAVHVHLGGPGQPRLRGPDDPGVDRPLPGRRRRHRPSAVSGGAPVLVAGAGASLRGRCSRASTPSTARPSRCTTPSPASDWRR